MKSNLLLLLPGLLAACGGDQFGEYYDGTAPDVSSVSVDGEEGNTGGQLAEISGSGFGDDPNGITVVFGHNNAEILSVSDSTIEVVVPRGPLEAGTVDIRVGTVGGQTVLEDAYTYDAGGDEDSDWYDDQVAYVAVTNDWASCYGGIGNTLADFCQEFAYTGLTGVGGKAEFLTYAFPRVHTLYTGERAGYGTSSDWTWGEWAVQKPTQDFIGIDIEAAYDEYRVEIDDFQIKSRRYEDEDYHVDMSKLAVYRYSGGDEGEDGSILDPVGVTPLATLAEEADEDEWGEPWVEEYDAGTMDWCMVPEYDEPRTWEYEPEWPVGVDWFRGSDGGEGPSTVYLDIDDVGLDDVELHLPPGTPFLATVGSAAAPTADWALYQTDSACPDSDEDGVTELDDAVWRFEWVPFDEDEYADGDEILGARSYVRLTINVLSLGWYGGWGTPIRAVLTVPDFNDYDEETGYSSLEVPAGIMYQFPSATYDAGVVTDPFGNETGFNWGDPTSGDYAYLVMSLERVTEYKMSVAYSSEIEGDIDGSLIFAYASGDVGFNLWDNPLDAGGCGDCIDNDGDGWTDDEDPDCQVEGAVDEDNSTFGDYTCNDGIDNDGDGDTDWEDEDCESGEDGETNCTDGEDNDGDGYTDEEDAECLDADGIEEGDDDPSWQCMDGEDNDGDTWIDKDDPDCVLNSDDEVGFGETECNDGVDNDGHGDVDGEDFACARNGADYETEQPEQKNSCADEEDNDGDTYVDANDPDCEVPPYSQENSDGMEEGDFPLVPVCYNSVDDDGDGWIDWEDTGCVNEFGEPDGFAADEQADVPGYTTCEDGEDNDSDGWTDDLDPDCLDLSKAEDNNTSSGDYQCDDRIDNDADGLTDEDDLECEAGWDDDESE